MNKYKSLYNHNTQFEEMSNHKPEQTGLKKGYIFISTKTENHPESPRIKFGYPNPPKKEEKHISILIPSLEILYLDEVSSEERNAFTSQRKEILKWAKINSKFLLEYWEDSSTPYDLKSIK